MCVTFSIVAQKQIKICQILFATSAVDITKLSHNNHLVASQQLYIGIFSYTTPFYVFVCVLFSICVGSPITIIFLCHFT